MSLPIEEREVILGVDTHLDVHVAVLIDVVGRVVATNSVPTTAIGYEQLIEWAGAFGRVSRAGVEGTGTYGAAIMKIMRIAGVLTVLTIVAMLFALKRRNPKLTEVNTGGAAQ